MTSPQSQIIIQDFENFQQFVRTECKMGRCTKQEAVQAILGKVQEILESLKVPEREYEREFINSHFSPEEYL